MPIRSRDYLLTSLLAALAVVLALLLAIEWSTLANQRGPASGTPPGRTGGPETDEPLAAAKFELPELDRYVQTVERPLFMETRQPGAEATSTAPPPAPPTPMHFKLMGVIRTPRQAIALIVDDKGKYRRLRLHDPPVDGWTLVEMDQDRVTMEQGDQREVLPLLKPRAAPPPPSRAQQAGRVPGRPTQSPPKPALPSFTGNRPPIPVPNAGVGNQNLQADDTDAEELDQDADVEPDTDENP